MYACMHTYMEAVTFIHRGSSRIEAGINRGSPDKGRRSSRHSGTAAGMKRGRVAYRQSPAERMLAAAA